MTLLPLITADEGYPALERLVDEAKHEICMSFRIFDPDTALRRDDLRARDLATWGDLLADVTSRGVRLRLILADFDPLFTSDLHRSAWRAAGAFAQRLTGDARILCAPHGQTAGSLWRLLLQRAIARKRRMLRSDDPDLLTPLQRRALEAAPILRPVTIHQKFAVADGARAVIGGLDIDERRFDDNRHRRAADDTWHDVSIAVSDAAFARALRAHFAATWNAALDCGAPALPGPAERDDSAASHPPGSGGPRLVRTFSAPCAGPGRITPRHVETEHETVLTDLLRKARRHVFVETQFLRHKPIVDALCAAARTAAELDCVIVLPPAPERVLFDGDTGLDARHAHALQIRALDRLTQAFGARLAVIAPAQPRAAQPDEPHILGSAPVYVHSKVTLVDDRVGLVGSANLNGRSMRWDTEASVLFDEAETVGALRDRLARKWLGAHFDTGDATRAETWRQAALSNAARDPDAREGFVLPFPQARGRRFATYLPLLPADMF